MPAFLCFKPDFIFQAEVQTQHPLSAVKERGGQKALPGQWPFGGEGVTHRRGSRSWLNQHEGVFLFFL